MATTVVSSTPSSANNGTSLHLSRLKTIAFLLVCAQTRISTKYNVPNLQSPKYQEKKRKRESGTEESEAAAAPKVPRAVLTLKTYDPESGVCLKFKTDRAADVGRLISGLGRLGRHMVALAEKTEGTIIGLKIRSCDSILIIPRYHHGRRSGSERSSHPGTGQPICSSERCESAAASWRRRWKEEKEGQEVKIKTLGFRTALDTRNCSGSILGINVWSTELSRRIVYDMEWCDATT